MRARQSSRKSKPASRQLKTVMDALAALDLELVADGYGAYGLLAAVGRDRVGALSDPPRGVVPAPAGTVDARRVSDTEIADILSGLGRNPLGVGDG